MRRITQSRIEALSEITFAWVGHLLFAGIGAGVFMVLAAIAGLGLPHVLVGLAGAIVGALVMKWRLNA